MPGTESKSETESLLRKTMEEYENQKHQNSTFYLRNASSNLSDYMQKSKERLNSILSENTGRTIEEIERDTDRDNFMGAEEALKYGLIDSVISRR